MNRKQRDFSNNYDNICDKPQLRGFFILYQQFLLSEMNKKAPRSLSYKHCMYRTTMF